MQKHIKNYRDYFRIGETDITLCEICHQLAVDLHHIEPRSKFGSKRKDEQDQVENIIALCRDCHDKAHGINGKLEKEYLQNVHNKKLEESRHNA